MSERVPIAAVSEALELLAEMQAQALEIDVISYHAAMSACEKGSQPNKHWSFRQRFRLRDCSQASLVTVQA